MFKITKVSPKFSKDFCLVLSNFVWKFSEISSESFKLCQVYQTVNQTSFIYLANLYIFQNVYIDYKEM